MKKPKQLEFFKEHKSPTKKFKFIKNLPFKNSLIINLICLALTCIFLGIHYQKLPSLVPLYYSLPQGKSQLAPKSALIFLIIISSFTILNNYLISIKLSKKEQSLGQMIHWSSVTLALLLSISLIKIVSIIS